MNELMIVSLEDIKVNSRIDYDDEDELLKSIGVAAEAMVENALHRTWFEVEAAYGAIPMPLKRAVLMLADHLWMNRSASGSQLVASVPYGVDVLVRPYVLLK